MILSDDFYYQADMNAIRSYERNEGREEGIKGMIEALQELGISKNLTSAKVSEKFFLNENCTEQLMQKYWREI